MKAVFEYEEDNFPKELTDISQDTTRKILDYFQSLYKIDMKSSFHNYKLLRLLFCLAPHKSNILVESLIESVKFIIETHDLKLATMNDLVADSFKKRDEALYFFWEYICTAKLIRDENLSFRKKTAYRFTMIHQILEHMLKREAYLLYSAFQVSNEKDIVKDVKLNEIIETLLMLPFEYFKNIDSKNLKNISINQWRNIAAHSSYECSNEKIDFTYSNNKRKVITLEELDKVIAEIYSLRLFVKLITNLTLDILQIRFSKYKRELRYVPETVVFDLNTYYEQFDSRIRAFELKDSIMIENKSYKEGNESYLEVEFESNYDERLKVVQLALLSIIQFSNIINEYNSTVKLEDVVWIFKIIFLEDDSMVQLSISFDEVSLLLEYPEGYIEMIERKLLQLSPPHLKAILRIGERQ